MTRLVWYETTNDADEAIAFEKKLKRLRRAKKIAMIGAANPDWRDISEWQSIEAIADPESHVDRLCELNVVDQVVNVCRATIVRVAWRRGHDLAVHGWIYDLKDGLLRDLEMCITNVEDIDPAFESRVEALASRKTRALAVTRDVTEATAD